MILWNEKEILGNIKGSYCNIEIPNITGVSIDSRTIKRGDLFIAIRGENFDGHDFINQAIKNGAYACIAEFIPLEVDADKHPIIIVDDVRDALVSLATYSRERTEAKIIGVTGSVGKTSVKDSIAFVLSTDGKTHSTSGNFNNDIGLPLSLCRMEADCKYGVFELGMNHSGELSYLSNILKPDIALITAIEAVHIEFFDSIEGIVDAKCEIFNSLVKGGVAIIPTGRHEHQIRKNCRDKKISNIVSFGIDANSDFALDKYISEENKNRVTANLKNLNKAITYDLGVEGKHNAVNSLAVLAVIDNLDLSIDKFKDEFLKLQAREGRGRTYSKNNGKVSYTLIDDSYNASPASIRCALENLKIKSNNNQSNVRKIAVLGDMLELGDKSEEFHRSLSEDVKKNGIDKVIAVGKLMKNLYKELPADLQGEYFDSYEKVEDFLNGFLLEGDILLLKGSHGSNIWKIAKSMIE